MNKAVARLTLQFDSSRSLSGTAWLCSSEYALTAMHCVASRENNELYSGAIMLDFCRAEAASIGVIEVVRFDADLDAALLRIPQDKIPATIKPIPIRKVPKRFQKPLAWFADGFPDAHKSGMRLTGAITDLDGHVGLTSAIQLFCDQGGQGYLTGTSGSAVYCGDAAIGLIRYGTLSQRIIFATALDHIAEKFPEISGLLLPADEGQLPIRSRAAALWEQRLESFLRERAIVTDPGVKFRLDHLIKEAWEQVGRLSGTPGALAIWQEKLDYLREHEAVTSDVVHKFEIEMQIEEAEQKIQELIRLCAFN